MRQESTIRDGGPGCAGEAKARRNHRNYRDLTVGGADDPGRAAERSPGAVPFGQIGARVEAVAGQQDEEREKPLASR